MALEKLSTNKVFEGELVKYKFKVRHRLCPLLACPLTMTTSVYAHQSEALGGLDARFNLFVPANASKGKVPVLVYLSGLTCTEDNAYVASPSNRPPVVCSHRPCFLSPLSSQPYPVH